ncbi:unnamed protein product [Amoebophrya sp. A120]|nr:unnamed protein product [Amoebophrya sp. A120]|eukprot:GSA120T00024917001.1
MADASRGSFFEWIPEAQLKLGAEVEQDKECNSEITVFGDVASEDNSDGCDRRRTTLTNPGPLSLSASRLPSTSSVENTSSTIATTSTSGSAAGPRTREIKTTSPHNKDDGAVVPPTNEEPTGRDGSSSSSSSKHLKELSCSSVGAGGGLPLRSRIKNNYANNKRGRGPTISLYNQHEVLKNDRARRVVTTSGNSASTASVVSSAVVNTKVAPSRPIDHHFAASSGVPGGRDEWKSTVAGSCSSSTGSQSTTARRSSKAVHTNINNNLGTTSRPSGGPREYAYAKNKPTTSSSSTSCSSSSKKRQRFSCGGATPALGDAVLLLKDRWNTARKNVVAANTTSTCSGASASGRGGFRFYNLKSRMTTSYNTATSVADAGELSEDVYEEEEAEGVYSSDSEEELVRNRKAAKQRESVASCGNSISAGTIASCGIMLAEEEEEILDRWITSTSRDCANAGGGGEGQRERGRGGPPSSGRGRGSFDFTTTRRTTRRSCTGGPAACGSPPSRGGVRDDETFSTKNFESGNSSSSTARRPVFSSAPGSFYSPFSDESCTNAATSTSCSDTTNRFSGSRRMNCDHHDAHAVEAAEEDTRRRSCSTTTRSPCGGMLSPNGALSASCSNSVNIVNNFKSCGTGLFGRDCSSTSTCSTRDAIATTTASRSPSPGALSARRPQWSIGMMNKVANREDRGQNDEDSSSNQNEDYSKQHDGEDREDRNYLKVFPTTMSMLNSVQLLNSVNRALNAATRANVSQICASMLAILPLSGGLLAAGAAAPAAGVAMAFCPNPLLAEMGEYLEEVMPENWSMSSQQNGMLVVTFCQGSLALGRIFLGDVFGGAYALMLATLGYNSRHPGPAANWLKTYILITFINGTVGTVDFIQNLLLGNFPVISKALPLAVNVAHLVQISVPIISFAGAYIGWQYIRAQRSYMAKYHYEQQKPPLPHPSLPWPPPALPPPAVLEHMSREVEAFQKRLQDMTDKDGALIMEVSDDEGYESESSSEEESEDDDDEDSRPSAKRHHGTHQMKMNTTASGVVGNSSTTKTNGTTRGVVPPQKSQNIKREEPPRAILEKTIIDTSDITITLHKMDDRPKKVDPYPNIVTAPNLFPTSSTTTKSTTASSSSSKDEIDAKLRAAGSSSTSAVHQGIERKRPRQPTQAQRSGEHGHGAVVGK